MKNIFGLIISTMLLMASHVLAQDIDVNPDWTQENTGAETEIGSLQKDGSYIVPFTTTSAREIQGLYSLLAAMKDKGAHIRAKKDFGGVITRSKMGIQSLTVISKKGASPAFDYNWSAIGSLCFEFHLKTTNTLTLGDGGLQASTIDSIKTSRSLRTFDLTFDYSSTTKKLTIRTKEVGSQVAGKSPVVYQYFVTGRTTALSAKEDRAVGGSFIDKIVSFNVGKESAASKTVIKTNLGPFWFQNTGGEARVTRSTFSDGRRRLNLRFFANWATDCEASVQQSASFKNLKCSSGSTFTAKVAVKDKFAGKGVEATYDRSAECSVSAKTIPVSCAWRAAGVMGAQLACIVEIKPSGAGIAQLRMINGSTLAYRFVSTADKYVCDVVNPANGSVQGGDVLTSNF